MEFEAFVQSYICPKLHLSKEEKYLLTWRPQLRYRHLILYSDAHSYRGIHTHYECLVSAAVWAFMDILSSALLASHETNVLKTLTSIQLQLIVRGAEEKRTG